MSDSLAVRCWSRTQTALKAFTTVDVAKMVTRLPSTSQERLPSSRADDMGRRRIEMRSPGASDMVKKEMSLKPGLHNSSLIFHKYTGLAA
jgi:hypothetical protein